MHKNNKKIHSSSVIESGAVIEDNVEIGPFCHIGCNVVLKSGVKLLSHVSIDGYTTIDQNTTIYPFASIGHRPQDLKYDNEPSKTIIGKNNQIREYVTIQPGTKADAMQTVVGDNCLLMVGVHIAHDCIVGNHVIMANNATLAGHVKVADHVIIGGLCAIKQFCRIGAHAIIGGMVGVENDVIPFGMVISGRGWLNGLNLVGMKRKGLERETIQKIQEFYNAVFFDQTRNMNERIKNVNDIYKDDSCVKILLDFLNSQSSALCQPKNF